MADTSQGATAPAAPQAAFLSRPHTIADVRHLHDGVEAVRSTVLALGAISNETCTRFGDDVDGRDYVLMAAAVDLLLSRAASGTPDYREGVCRALADLLALTGEEWSGNAGAARSADWNPIATSERAFAAARSTTNPAAATA